MDTKIFLQFNITAIFVIMSFQTPAAAKPDQTFNEAKRYAESLGIKKANFEMSDEGRVMWEDWYAPKGGWDLVQAKKLANLLIGDSHPIGQETQEGHPSQLSIEYRKDREVRMSVEGLRVRSINATSDKWSKDDQYYSFEYDHSESIPVIHVNGKILVTIDMYKHIETDMFEIDVYKILDYDLGDEISSSKIGELSTVSKSWKNYDGSNLFIIFQNGKVVSKSQFGLKPLQAF